MHSWQLPEYIADILPSAARQLENAQESLLELFRVHGYALVRTPMMEYTQSLLTRIDPGLSLKTLRITDQLSGRQLGIRADITPQISRIDAHLLAHKMGINRLCYAGAVVHAQPDTLYSTREPLQIGAELYGFAGLAADIELIDLMLKSMAVLGERNPLLSLGHIQIFRALAQAAHLSDDDSTALLSLMQQKDSEPIGIWCTQKRLSAELSDAFILLPQLFGFADEVLQKARQHLPPLEPIIRALDDLTSICKAFKNHPIHLDLAELRVDPYHSGLVFAVYRDESPDALARGGRYDGLGRFFGRSRPATGFSFDLKNFLYNLPSSETPQGILVKSCDAAEAQDEINRLRNEGQMVVVDYLDEGAEALHCNRLLQPYQEKWQVIAAH